VNAWGARVVGTAGIRRMMEITEEENKLRCRLYRLELGSAWSMYVICVFWGGTSPSPPFLSLYTDILITKFISVF
jgi:hypothetical protein